MDIKKIVKENLEKKYSVNESFERIFLHEDADKRFGLTMEYLNQLIDEGYDEDQLKTVIDEQFGWLKSLASNAGDTISKATGGMGNLLSKSLGGGWSQFKEFLISNFLEFLGFKGPLAHAIATAMNEMALADIISVFRGRQGCLEHGPTVADALSEALVRFILEEMTEQDSMAFNFIRNTIFEYVKSSHFGETLSATICNAAYKTSQVATKNLPLSSSNMK